MAVLPDFYVFREYCLAYLLIFYFAQYRVDKRILDKLAYLISDLVGVSVFFLVVLKSKNIPLREILGYWNWASPIEWSIYFLLSFYLLDRKMNDPVFSLTLSGLSANAGGYLYEVPILMGSEILDHRPILWVFLRYSGHNLFIISGQVISLVLLLLIIKNDHRLHIKSGKTLWFFLIVFVLTSIFNQFLPSILYWMNPNQNYYYKWIVRLPLIFLMLQMWRTIDKRI